jgi:hypothetical protein
MNLSAARPGFSKSLPSMRVRSSTVYGVIIILALVGFELFNFSTTLYALKDLLGNLKFLGIPWSTFLAIAFCGIDFAGIARLINPDTRTTDLKESWYLFAAWLLAATANAALTWWGVAVAISGHHLQSASVMSTNTLTHVIPVFIAILVWVIRVLIIASLTTAIDRLTGKQSAAKSSTLHMNMNTGFPTSMAHSSTGTPRPLTMTRNPRPAAAVKAEPTYQDLYSSRNFTSNENHQNHTKSF